MDADLQHPPELLGEFVKRWQTGADVVVGLRRGSSKMDSCAIWPLACFYATLSKISKPRVMPHATDFRLLDRKVIDEFKRFTEHNRLSRGLIDWLGFNCSFIEFTPNRRHSGRGYSKVQLVRLALNSYVSHSLVPLKLAGYLGIIITLVSAPLGVFIFVEKYMLDDPFISVFQRARHPSRDSTILVGIILICLGLISLYIANIHVEVMNRPLYIVRDKSK